MSTQDKNLTNNEMDRKKFNELINITRVKYLLSLTDNTIRKTFWSKEEQDSDGVKWDWKTYVSSVREFLRDILKKSEEEYRESGRCYTHFIFERKYKYATGKDYGRLYTRKFSIQSLQYRLRNFLITGQNKKPFYTDLDMENAHFSILYGLVQNYNKDKDGDDILDCRLLKKYVLKRKECFKKCDFTKKEALILLNSDTITHNKKNKNSFYIQSSNPQTLKQKFLVTLYEEINSIKNTWFLDNDFEKYKGGLSDKKNPKSSFLNRIMCDNESQLLQKAIKFLEEDEGNKCIIPMFDGLLISGDMKCCTKKQEKLIINDLNELTKSSFGHSINWVVKPVKDDADVDPEDIEDAIENCDLYMVKKHDYERTRCFIRKSGSYQTQYKDKDNSYTWIHYPKNQMEEDGANQPCIDFKGKPSNVFIEWRKDTLRRQYEDIDFIPYNPREPVKCEHIFNTFEGMKFDYNQNYSQDEPNTQLKEYLLNTLANGDEKVYEYLYYTLAQIIQEPNEKTGVATILTGEEGVGKDTIIYLIRKLLGSNYVCATNRMEDITPKRGAFNMKLKDKIVIEFNETTGRDGNDYMEQLKDFITREENDIRELYKAPYKQKQISRLFLFGNGLNPITMKDGQRRFIWIKINGSRKGDVEYWDKLYSDFDSKSWINDIGNELLNVDYGDYFKKRNFPETEVMKQYYKLNRPKEVDFLYNEIVQGEAKKSCKIINTGDITYIETAKLYQLFQNYCDKNSLPLTFEGRAWSSLHFKKMIEQYSGVETNKMRTFKTKNGNISKRMFKFDKILLGEALNKRHNFDQELDEEIIELIDDNIIIQDDSDDELDHF